MDPYFRIENLSSGATVNLNEIALSGYGLEGQVGATGLGLPPMSVLTDEGAGDGSTYRGRKVNSRTIDIPIRAHALNRDDLRRMMDRLSIAIDGRVRLTFVDYVSQWNEESGTWSDPVRQEWSVIASITGGGSYAYGIETDPTNAEFTLTFSSEQPYWEFSETVKAQRTTSGALAISNIGTVKSYPVWTITGPTLGFALERKGETLRFPGFIRQGEQIIIDSATGTVKDNQGSNRYGDISSFPRFFPINGGDDVVNVTLDQFSSGYLANFVNPRTNYVTNPNFSTNATGWTLTQMVQGGVMSGRLNVARGTSVVMPSAKTTVTGLTVGKTYVARAQMANQADAPPTGYVQNSGFISMTGANGSFKTLTDNKVTKTVKPEITFVATDSTMEFMWRPSVATSGTNIFRPVSFLDWVYVGEPGAYFDGDSTDWAQESYSWAGEPNNSVSLATPPVLPPTTGASAEISFKPRKWWLV